MNKVRNISVSIDKDDQVWLHFSTDDGRNAMLNLNNIAHDMNKVGITRQICLDAITTAANSAEVLAEETPEARLAKGAYALGYDAGHNDTVEGVYIDNADEVAQDWLIDALIDGGFHALMEDS